MSTASEIAPTKCVGPDYRAEEQKPTATVSTAVNFDNVTVLSQTPQLIALLRCVCLPRVAFQTAVRQTLTSVVTIQHYP